MRTIELTKTRGTAETLPPLTITEIDPPAALAPRQTYEVSGFAGGPLKIVFQHGDPAEVGRNGVSVGELQAVIRDHLGTPAKKKTATAKRKPSTKK